MDRNQIKSEIEKTVKSMENELVDLSCKFVSFNSVNPKTNGPGEKEVALWLENIVKKMKFDRILHIDAKDTQVPYGYRPNILSILNGQSDEKTIWFMTHMDKVPAGDLSLWESDPLNRIIKDGKIHDREAEDIGSSLVASIIALKAIQKLEIKPRYNVGLMFVSDEATGSEFGIEHVVNNFKFGKDDWFIVPDSGNPVGNEIEIAEKSIIWLKMTTVGKQAHASMPQLAKNAHRIGIKCALEIDNFIHEKYNFEDPLFTPSASTFEPTKKEANVENVNTIPGVDVICFDGRILPSYDLEKILTEIREIADKYEKEYDVSIKFEILQKGVAPEPTPADHPLVKSFSSALKDVRNFDPKLVGIGGGTCAAILRKAGFPAIVWATIDETAHQPNENISIKYMLDDAIVYAYFLATL